MSIPEFLKPCLMVFSATILTITILTGCGGSSTSSTNSVTQSYNGPGSRWEIDYYSGGTFGIDHYPNGHNDANYSVQGNYQLQTSGFTTLTATAVTGTGGPALNSTAWAIEVPGYAFLLKPTTEDRIITMLKEGECPSSNFSGNFVVTKKDLITAGNTGAGTAGADQASVDFFGSFDFNVTTGVTTLTSLDALTIGFPSTINNTPLALSAGTCSAGIVTLSDSIIYLTSNAGGMVHLNTDTATDIDDSFLFALPQKAITNINNLQGNYIGILFDDNSSPKVQPVSLSCNTGGNCTGNLVTDVITGATDNASSVNVFLDGTVDSPSNGRVTGSISDGFDTGRMACVVDLNALNSGTKIISCVGQSPVSNADIYNVIFISI